MVISLGAVLFSVLTGTLLGILSGIRRGWPDLVLQRLVEIFQSFPGILLAILIIFAMGKPSSLAVILALSVTGWTGYARVVRNQVISLRNDDFITAAGLLNLGSLRITLRHILPNIAGEVAVLMTFHVAGTILAEAGLSFLGLGPQDSVSWGALLEQGAVLFIKAPTIGMAGGAAIALTVLGVNFLGDYLRDAFDAKRNTVTGRPAGHLKKSNICRS